MVWTGIAAFIARLGAPVVLALSVGIPVFFATIRELFFKPASTGISPIWIVGGFILLLVLLKKK